MKQEQWATARTIFEALLAMAPDERETFLDREVGPSSEVRKLVERLLQAESVDDDFLEPPSGRGWASQPRCTRRGQRGSAR